jgi:hypothetical protein
VKADWKTCACGEIADYCATYDAVYCAKCDLWLEQRCGFPAPADCYYDCANRPEKPSAVSR